MKTRPIPFSGPMIDAIRAGRKTQTRRVIPRVIVDSPRLELLGDRPFYLHSRKCINEIWCLQEGMYTCGGGYFLSEYAPRYGRVGDRLRIRRGWFGEREDSVGLLEITGMRVERVGDITAVNPWVWAFNFKVLEING